jgi:hypothetical protein
VLKCVSALTKENGGAKAVENRSDFKMACAYSVAYYGLVSLLLLLCDKRFSTIRPFLLDGKLFAKIRIIRLEFWERIAYDLLAGGETSAI